MDVNEYQAVLFYQTSGNTDGKSASFTMNGGTLNCEYGTVFRAYSSADVYLNDVAIDPYDSNLLIASQGAGSSGANVNFTAGESAAEWKLHDQQRIDAEPDAE